MKAGRVLVIYGPRRIGKTTLLEQYLLKVTKKYLVDSGDSVAARKVLSSQDFRQIADYVSGYELIVIDEAQQIPDVGMGLKIIIDQHPDIQVIATGSSSFDLANKIGEPLTGRKTTLTLFPIAQMELLNQHNVFELKQKKEDFLVFGSYPEVVVAKSKEEKIKILKEIAESYLFKDILSLDNVRNPNALMKLVKLLAFQIGKPVSISELATQVGLNSRTVERYLDLLEKAFVIKSLGSFGRNLRKEIAKKRKYYFFDNGIRNAVIGQFNSFEERNDRGELWENFLIMERIKRNSYKGSYYNFYFWRSYDQKEIDWIEEGDGKIFAYEIKLNKEKFPIPERFLELYPESRVEIIHQDNYFEFIT
ncbi:MAG: ATP-binding protein [Parcubacteria group bacterium]|nr:ATP-binding protein [Parcubacteria group bacterium]